MNLETQIKSELWTAIADSYQSENYTHAIKDAMAFVTEVLRDKSGLDGDGDKLVGQALGFSRGKRPRISINPLQTQTERDMQRGLMFLLKGMYALVRNPRTHERLQDSKKIADTVILFVNYLIDFLGSSQQSFTVQDFSNMVADPHFVPDPEYVGGLVDRIPIRKQGDTLISLYREINWKQSTNFQMVIRELISRLPDSEIDDFMSVVSEDLLRVEQVGSATLVIKVLPNELWPRIQRMSRLRIEKILLDELENAWYIPDSKRTNSSASTWISGIAEHYIRKYRLRGVIINKLKKKDFDHHNFVAEYLMAHDALPDIFEEEQHIKQCVSAIAESIRSGNEFMKNSLVQYIMTGPPPGWEKKFLESLNDLTDPDNPEVYLYDGTPFLGKFVPRPNPVSEPIGEEEELPF